jgi:carboxyl-terminal processing protease
MPRRNLLFLVAISALSLVCYVQADSVHRSHYGRMFDTFVEVMEKIEDKYLEPVDERELFEGALEGMVSKLDPYSEYIGPNHYNEFRENLEQEFGGIGILVAIDRDTKMLTVISPMVGTPAYQGGILSGDTILKVDGESTEGFTSEDAQRRLRGKPDKPVRLTVLHKGASEPVELEIKRKIIEVPTVLGDTRLPDGKWDYFLEGHPGIGYVRITTFGEKTVEELKTALAWLAERHVRGVILDLRNDAGGLLTAANGTCDLFLKKDDRIVSTRGREGVEKEAYNASGKGLYQQLPLVVLVNQYTASASEIVAACLQDHNRAKVVGQRTWGKGSVQNVIPLEGGRSGLKLTIASFWRPSEQNIHRRRNATDKDVWGVMPSPGYEVKFNDSELAEVVRRRRDRDVVQPPGAAAATHSSPASPMPANPESKEPDAIEPKEKQPVERNPRPDKPIDVQKPGSKETEMVGDPQLDKAVEAIEQEIAAAGGM